MDNIIAYTYMINISFFENDAWLCPNVFSHQFLSFFPATILQQEAIKPERHASLSAFSIKPTNYCIGPFPSTWYSKGKPHLLWHSTGQGNWCWQSCCLYWKNEFWSFFMNSWNTYERTTKWPIFQEIISNGQHYAGLLHFYSTLLLDLTSGFYTLMM